MFGHRKQRYIFVGITRSLKMGRNSRGRRGATPRRKRCVGLDQFFLKCEKGNLIGPGRRHRRFLRHRRLHRDCQAHRTENSFEHEESPIVAVNEKPVYQIASASA
jgi:hypothetical protein